MYVSLIYWIIKPYIFYHIITCVNTHIVNRIYSMIGINYPIYMA